AALWCADELYCPRHHRFRPLSALAHHQHGFTEARGLLLNAARIGEHEVGDAEHPGELSVCERFDKEHVVDVCHSWLDRPPHLRILVDGEDDGEAWVLPGEICHRPADLLHLRAEILTAMRRHKEDLPTGAGSVLALQPLQALVFKAHLQGLRREL